MSEKLIQEGLKAIIAELPAFSSAKVVINDYSLLDQSVMNAPYVIIENSNNFLAEQNAPSPETQWDIPAMLVERFTEWKATCDNLRDRRQAIIAHFNSGDNRAAGQSQGTSVDTIRNGTDILPIYQAYNDQDYAPDETPVFLYQQIIFVVKEY